MMIRGEIEPAHHAVFSDTGWEPKAVYEHLGKMREEAESAGIKVHIVNNGNLRRDALTPGVHFGSMPLHVLGEDGKKSIGRRSCTSEYKLKPLLRKQRELAGLRRYERCKEHRITTIIGISWDEVHRMKTPFFPWIQNEYPLVDRRITRQDCLKWNIEHGYERPPRSSCIGCPLHSKAEWLHLKQSPDDWADAVEFDRLIRVEPYSDRMFNGRAYLHLSLKPLDEANLGDVEDDGQQTLFGLECEGMCGL